MLVRHIGVGDVPRRIIAKAILHVIGSCQLGLFKHVATGHDAGSEAAIYAMRVIFEDNNTHAALLVDATNAFNLVNHQAVLHNISLLCPSFSTILKNMYGAPIRLFITGEGELASTV